MAWYVLPLFIALSGCGTLQKWALRSANPVFEKSTDGVMREGNWEFLKNSSPGNLKFMELLYQQDKDNLKLLSSLIKAYS